MGHHKDGSGIQNHSVGELYPCIIYSQETPEGRKFGLITPKDQQGSLYPNYDAAVAAGLQFNKVNNAV